jgi:multiple sugar transport system permease protein
MRPKRQGVEHRPLIQRLSYSENFWGYLFLTPTVLGLLFFSAGPILAAAAFSLTKWNIVSPAVWRGVSNYRALLHERLFWISIRNTLRYMAGAIPLSMGLSLILAMALNQKLRLEALFRTIYFTPSVCSVVALALIWRMLLDKDLGIINYFLSMVGIPKQPWLLSPKTAMLGVIIMSVWNGIGYPTLLWLAGLQGVPEVYYDAALVDGAGRWAKFRYVTWPFLTPTAFFMLIISCINSFQVFESTYVLTAGGPQRSTYTLVYYIYEAAFREFNMGYASALAYVLFFFVLILTIVQFRLQRAWVHYEMA